MTPATSAGITRSRRTGPAPIDSAPVTFPPDLTGLAWALAVGCVRMPFIP